MRLKLCEPKNILEKKGALMLKHICYDTNGSAVKGSGDGYTGVDTLKILSQRHKPEGYISTKYDCPCSANKSFGKKSAQPDAETDESFTLAFLLAKGTPKCKDVGTNARSPGKSEISDLGCNCNLCKYYIPYTKLSEKVWLKLCIDIIQQRLLCIVI